jgi:hypothetical protein
VACLDLTNGDFADQNWSNANFDAGDLTITRNGTTSAFVEHVDFTAGLTVTGDVRHIVIANTRALILVIQDSVGTSTRTVYALNITASGSTPGLVQLLVQASVSTGHALPAVAISPGNGMLAVVSAPTDGVNPNEFANINMWRTDSGDLMVNGPLVLANATDAPSGRVTASEIIILHPNSGLGSDQTTAPRPIGELQVVGGTVDFGEAVLGADNPALATVTRTVTLRNDGTDCIIINDIGDMAPYALTPTSRTQLPVELDPGETADFDIVFAPAAPGNNINRDLPITRTPAQGDSVIPCTGDARAAVAAIAVSPSSIAFGTREVGAPATVLNYTVSNTGEVTVAVSIADEPPGSHFDWDPLNAQVLAPGANTGNRQVRFTPLLDGPSPGQTITITATNGAANRTVTLTGAGCVPNAAIAPVSQSPLDFRDPVNNGLERGFRTVRVRDIVNIGDDTLTFTARIDPAPAPADPADAALFGLVLPGGDITDAPAQRSYSVPPEFPCPPGPTGSRAEPVGVSFFADGPARTCEARLVITGHNATNTATPSWEIPLIAAVLDPVPVDIALVLDRSGSMADMIGSRNKMEAALAGANLLVQMLRDTADDRCAIIAYETLPETEFPIALVNGNRAAMLGTLTSAVFTPGTATNIAGGAILGAVELAQLHPTASPPALRKAMVVLTDGMENRAFQEAGTGPWLSITGRDAPNMWDPAGNPVTSNPWVPPADAKVYAIGLGQPSQIDAAALDQLASATGGSYEGAEDLTGKSWFNLEKYFTQIFMETASLQQLSDPFFTIPAGAKHVHEFDLLPGDVNFMVVLYDFEGQRLPFFIESPTGELFRDLSVPPGFGLRVGSSPTARFVEVRLPGKDPKRYTGRWKVVVVHDGYVCMGPVGGTANEKDKGKKAGKDGGAGFLPEKCRKEKAPVDYGIAIGAGSNLRMQPWVDPATTYVGQDFRLNASVVEAGLPVTKANVRVVVETPGGQSYTLTLRDDGVSQDGQADDGDYGGRFSQTYQPGNYQLTFIAEGMIRGLPWRREAHRTKPVFSKRKPPRDDNPGDKDDWCRRLWILMGGLKDLPPPPDEKPGKGGKRPAAGERPKKPLADKRGRKA